MFESAYLKVDRATHHIRDLQATVARYAKKAGIDFYPDGSFVTITVDRRAEPECSAILGDAIHNLRSALEHAFWELIGIDGGTQDKYTTFPIHRGNRVDYEAHCKGVKTPRQDTKDFLICVQAYPDGVGASLVDLHDLDILDKHAMLNPVFGLVALRDCVIVRPNGVREDWAAIGGDYARTLIHEDGQTVVRPFGEGRFELNQNTQASLDILFGDTETSVELEPVIPVLDKFVSEIRNVLVGMERLVAKRD